MKKKTARNNDYKRLVQKLLQPKSPPVSAPEPAPLPTPASVSESSTDTEALQARIAQLEETLRSLKQKWNHERDILHREIILLKNFRFGKKSERLPALESQMELFGPQEDAPVESDKENGDEPSGSDTQEGQEKGADGEKASPKKRNRGKRKPLPPELRRVRHEIDLPEAQKVCACGCSLRKIGEQVSETLELQPLQLWVRQDVVLKYACPTCEGVESEGPTVVAPPLPARLFPKSYATPSLLAFLAVAKYADGLPLYRQSTQFARLGIDLSRATLSRWMLRLGQELEPLAKCLAQEVRSGPLIQMDETTLQVLGEQDRKNTTKSYVWVARGGRADRPAVLFHYTPTRHHTHPAHFLKDYKGHVQTDGYSGYEFLDNAKLKAYAEAHHVGCMAHARRKFIEILKSSPQQPDKVAAQVLALIQELYRIERKWADSTDWEAIRADREQRARPVLEKIKKLLDEHRDRMPKQTKLGAAVHYTLGQWSRLMRYLDQGYLPIDNNRVENQIRPFVLGRKNWLFAGDPEGAKASAILYSLIETAKANAVEPFAYLKWLFEKLPEARTASEWMELLPTRVSDPKLMMDKDDKPSDLNVE